jgi:hypothetical protein
LIVELPEWQPFSPGATPWIPDASRSGRIVAVLAPAAARRDGWAVRLALDLAGMWGDAGQRVVLADGVLEYPMLHREIGLPNDEGVSDAALFGASIARVARPVPGRSFFFVSAGSPTGNPDSVAGSPRWHRLRNGFKDAGVTLVLFVREGCAAEEELTREADDVVVLAGSGEDMPPSARRMAGKVRVVFGPEAAPATAVEPGSEAESDLEVDPIEPDGPDLESDRLPTDATEIQGAYDPFGDVPDDDGPDDDVVAAELGDRQDAASASDAPEDFLHFSDTDDAALSEDAGLGEDPTKVDDALVDDTHAADDAVAHDAPHASGLDPRAGADAGATREGPAAGYAPIRSSRRKRASDSGTGKKFLWAGIVLVAVILVAILLGGLGSG